MSEENVALCLDRMARSKRCLASAEANLSLGDWENAANRAYYTVFNAMRSLLALEDVDRKKHAGVIAFFRERYIKTGILSESLSLIITNLYDLRSECDYADFIRVEPEEVCERVHEAAAFFMAVREYLTQQGICTENI
ncbi:MAG: HEPN domain-containing protein [Planctomycetia bacterium]|nr:HEPN domain-containing protein [Planctomycetia bacterium]